MSDQERAKPEQPELSVNFLLGENITRQHFWRYSLEHEAAAVLVSAFQELPHGTATLLPFPSAAQHH